MSGPKGGIIGAQPAWTTTATSGIWTLRQAEEMKADGKWPRGPEAPTSLTASAGNAQLTLSWTAPATTHGTITNYLVEYTPSGGSAQYVLTGSTSTSYTLTGLTNGTEYSVRVAAVNFTAGNYSQAATGTPSAFTPVTVALTSGTSYTVPAGATSATVWVVGGGGGGDYDPGSTGASGGVAKKLFSVSGGNALTYTVGAAGRTIANNGYTNNSNTNGGNTTATYGGVTITGGGGKYKGQGGTGGTFSGGDSGTNGLDSISGRFVDGPRSPDHSGLYDAIAAAGGANPPNFGRGGRSGEDYDDVGSPQNGSAGVVVISFA